ncbi:MAG: hypothetical protein EOM20_02675 [Spartobacteria bacterium]|nr:hypothetical protein [Spartobacteria bacterium]
MPAPNTPHRRKPIGSLRLQIFLSAFMLPGAGQFLQKRWLPGMFYSITFLGCFIFIILQVALPGLRNLRIAMDAGSTESFAQTQFAGIAMGLLTGLTLYLANLLDVYRAGRK